MSADDRETTPPPVPAVTLAPAAEVRALACERAAALLRGRQVVGTMSVPSAQVVQVARFILDVPADQPWPDAWPTAADLVDRGGEPA